MAKCILYGSGANNIIPGTDNINGLTYREATINGIKDAWSGEYNKKNVNVEIMDVSDGKKHYIKEGQQFYNVAINNRAGVPNHSGWFAKNKIGQTNLYTADSRDGKNVKDFDVGTFSLIAAHEFGHALGISDAYDATSIKTQIPSIMYDQYVYNKAQAVDYSMMLKVSRTNKWQAWNRNLNLLNEMGIKYN